METIKKIFDVLESIIMVLCKLFLIADIAITSMAVAGRYISFIPDPAWSEEIVLTCMIYMALVSAALAIRHRTHIRMTALDGYLPKKVLKVLDIFGDVLVLAFAIVMVVEGLPFAMNLGAKGTYVSLPSLSKFWLYFPVPLAGIAMTLFQLEALLQDLGIVKKEGGNQS